MSAQTTATARFYGDDFFDSIESGSRQSAEVFVPLLLGSLAEIRSVVDVGCGRGAWLQVWQASGVHDVFGIDGDYVDVTSLLIHRDAFSPVDLTEGFRLGRHFDLAQCLEVAEHLPKTAADALIDSLVAHSDFILFSAAIPGQGGVNHINERPLEYWREKFGARGYLAFDTIRPAVATDNRVCPWYRYNSILYVAEHRLPGLPDAVRSTEINRNSPIPNLRPLRTRLACAGRRCLPEAVSRQLDRSTAKLMRGLRRVMPSRPSQ